jgi:hypothetical protein
MSLLVVSKCKDKRIKSMYCQKKAKAKPIINRIRYKKLSLDNVQTSDGIFETTHKLKNATPRTLLY